MIAGSSASSSSVSFTRSARERPAAGSSSIISLRVAPRAPCRPRAGAARRARARRRASSSRSPRPTGSAIARAFSRISASPARRHQPQVAVVRRRARPGRGCPRRTGRGTAARSGTCARGPCARACAPAASVTSWPNSSTRAGGRRELARDQVEQRRLAGAVGAEDRPALAGPDLEVDVGTAWTPPKRRPTPRKRRIGSARSADVAGAATSTSPKVDLLGVADPRRRRRPSRTSGCSRSGAACPA